jgi:hypothetical protein
MAAVVVMKRCFRYIMLCGKSILKNESAEAAGKRLVNIHEDLDEAGS